MSFFENIKQIVKKNKEEEIILKALSEELNVPQDKIQVRSYEKIERGVEKGQIKYIAIVDNVSYEGTVAAFGGPPCVISKKRLG